MVIGIAGRYGYGYGAHRMRVVVRWRRWAADPGGGVASLQTLGD